MPMMAYYAALFGALLPSYVSMMRRQRRAIRRYIAAIR